MEFLSDLLTDLIGNEQLARIVFVSLTAIAIFALTNGLLALGANATDPLRRRLHGGAKDADTKPRKPKWDGSFLLPWSKYLIPGKEAERSRVADQLRHAGIRAPNAMTTYYAIKTVLAVLLPACVMMSIRWLPEMDTRQIIFAITLAAFVGVMAPNFVLQRMVDSRQRELRHAFPDALDLLVVCVEAGLGLSAAIQRVGREIEVSHPTLAAELDLVTVETRAGVKRVEALRNLADRTGLDDIRGLVTLLAQTLRFGTSIADTLRVYSEEFRDKRMQAAEEKAAKIGTKLIFPLTFCMFPAFFIVAIGPAVLKVMAAFS